VNFLESLGSISVILGAMSRDFDVDDGQRQRHIWGF
jgi:hypothetical protein